MENNFLCPKCRGELKVGEYLVFSASTQNKQSGLLMLSPQIGNYSSIKHPNFKFKRGDHVTFFCPICHDNLTTDINKNLARIILVEEDKEFDIYFSKISGEHATYKVKGDEVEASGEDAGLYTYFKLPEKFKKYL